MAQSRQELQDRIHDWPLSKALAKALVWAESAGDAELVRWVRLESLGYWTGNPVMTDSTIVPEYRTVSGEWFDDYNRRLVLSDPKLAFVNETRLRLGAAELESYVGVTGVLALPNPDHAALIREHLKVEVSTFRFNAQNVPPVLASIRAQLVDRLARSQGKDNPPRSIGSNIAATDDEIIEIRPNFAGIGVNLRALWRKWRSTSGDD
jgi:hypothetical protein